MHEELARWHARTRGAGSWYDDPDGILDAHRRRDIADARRRLARDGKVETPGRIVAELTFGFWRYLLTKRYERTLWTPAVRHAFPHLRPARRSTLYTSVDTLLRLRNRVAHHEPIHNRPLIALHDDLLRVVSYMDPDVAVWTGERSRVPTMLALRPASPSRRAPQ